MFLACFQRVNAILVVLNVTAIWRAGVVIIRFHKFSQLNRKHYKDLSPASLDDLAVVQLQPTHAPPFFNALYEITVLYRNLWLIYNL